MSEELILPFFSDDPEFIDGYETGSLYERIRLGDQIKEQPIHRRNKAQLELVCVHFDRKYNIYDMDENWSMLTIE